MVDNSRRAEVVCLDCRKLFTVYPEDVTGFWVAEIESYLIKLGWSVYDNIWRCPECSEKLNIEEALYPSKQFLEET